MKAFLVSLVALVVISAVAAVVLGSLPMSSRETYTELRNVRL